MHKSVASYDSFEQLFLAHRNRGGRKSLVQKLVKSFYDHVTSPMHAETVAGSTLHEPYCTIQKRYGAYYNSLHISAQNDINIVLYFTAYSINHARINLVCRCRRSMLGANKIIFS